MSRSILVITLLWLAGCATVQPRFEDSNQIFIEKTATSLNIGSIIKEKIPAKSKIALVSLEEKVTLDKPVIAIIEDQVIKSLVDNEFVVLERDQHLVYDFLKEKGPTYSIIHNRSQENQPLPTVLATTDKANVQLKQGEFNTIEIIPTQLSTADYIPEFRPFCIHYKLKK